MIRIPVAIATDSYKAGHFAQYPGATKMVAYGEFRREPGWADYEKLVFYGIRYIVEEYLYRRWTQQDVDIAADFYRQHNAGNTQYPFPEELFRKFVRENDGYFPVKLQALPEGSVIYPHVPVYQITAEGEYAPLVTFLETLLTQVWYPSTVATLSRHTKQYITEAFEQSVDPDAWWKLNSRLHDFGFRGTTCLEQSVLGGLAHLLNFEGSDTMSACYVGQYQLNNKKPIAQSIPATEHSVMTSWVTEEEAVRNMIQRFGSGVMATVGDSYDWNRFLNVVVPKLAPEMKAKGGFWVVRPDSGDPVKCVVEALVALEKAFGVTVNSKGYKVIQGAGVIQGDGIDIGIVQDILDAVLGEGYSAENVAFGMGGGLLQKLNRDTMSFATKLSHITYQDGTKRDLMKTPATDSGKFSLPGELQVNYCNGAPTVYPVPAKWEEGRLEDNQLRTVYDKRPIGYIWDDFDTVRARVESQWKALPKFHDPISGQLKEKISAVKAAQAWARAAEVLNK